MKFGLLGPLLVRDGDTVLPIPAGKQRAVLAVLLTRAGRAVPIDEMIGLIWADSPPKSARVTLCNYVKRLRGNQMPIQTRGPGYLIQVASGDLDTARFKKLYAAGCQAAQRQRWATASARFGAALSLWRGRPFEDICCPLLNDAEAPGLTALRLEAQEARIEADLHLGRHRSILPELRHLTETEPLRESLHALYMLALYRSGRQADALAAYHNARRVLISELGLEPGPQLREMQRRILTTDPPRPAGTPLTGHQRGPTVSRKLIDGVVPMGSRRPGRRAF